MLFERGILGKKVFIKTMDSPIVKSMDSGFRYFLQWLDEKLDDGRLYHTSALTLYNYCNSFQL